MNLQLSFQICAVAAWEVGGSLRPAAVRATPATPSSACGPPQPSAEVEPAAAGWVGRGAQGTLDPFL